MGREFPFQLELPIQSWELDFEQEGMSLFLVLAFPAFLKVAPALIAAAQVKLLLLQELMGKAGDMWQ